MHKQYPQTAYRNMPFLIGTIFENCDKWYRTWRAEHPEFEKIVFHGLRHSSATYQLIESGGDVKTVQRPCKWRIKEKSHEESYDSSWDFGALEGTRIPGPLIKSQMLYRLSYERIFCGKTIPPNNITTIGCKMQEQRSKKRKFQYYTKNHSKNLCARRCSSSTSSPV